MRSYGGRVFLLGEHLRRLAASASFLRLRLPYTQTQLAEAVNLVAGGDSSIRLTVTRGQHTGSLSLETDHPPTVIIQAKPVVDYPEEYRRSGMPVCVSAIRRDEASPIVRHKTLNYLESLLARAEAAERGCGEALLLNTAGFVAEGATSNVLWVRRGEVCTPSVDAGLLAGIVRELVIRLCCAERIRVHEGLFAAGELLEADEVFLTNSLMELMPVRSIDGQEIRGGAPGPVTSRLVQAYRREVERSR
jgi:branched-chain amino acid aminotransferase